MKTLLFVSLIVMTWVMIIGFVKMCFFEDLLENKQLKKQNEWLEDKMKSLMYDYYQLKKEVKED